MTLKTTVLYICYLALIAVLITVIATSFKSSSTKVSHPTSDKNAPTLAHKAPSTSSNNSKTSRSAPTLANSGPGDVIGLFIAVTSLFTLLHWRWTLNRLY